MSQINKQSCKIVKRDVLGTDIISLVIECPDITANAKAGQFVNVYCKDGAKLLPRPISLCGIDKENGCIRIVFRIVGEGTKEIAAYAEGDSIEVMGPLGNGFPIMNDKKAIIIGGGIGIPPMLGLAKELQCEKNIVLGYRDELFLNEEFEGLGNIYISSEDGKTGTKGNVIDAIKANAVEGDVIFACGPTPMLRGIKEYAAANNITAYISLEERMACGIGACLACVCKSKEKDHHTNVNNKRICKDGPVFEATEVEI